MEEASGPQGRRDACKASDKGGSIPPLASKEIVEKGGWFNRKGTGLRSRRWGFESLTARQEMKIWVWSNLARRLLWEQETGGSNPSTQTRFELEMERNRK